MTNPSETPAVYDVLAADRDVLRPLAAQVAAIASLPVHRE